MSGFASPPAVAAGLLLGMVASLELGFRTGSRARSGDERSHDGLGTIEAAIFALLGLLLGFAFAGATSRLDARRQLIVREANGIGTAYLRLDLLPPSAQPDLRRLFREYLELRLRAYATSDLDVTDRDIAQATELQRQIWTRLAALAPDDQTHNVARTVVPAVNEMIDVTTARTLALRTHLPIPILALLIVVALMSAFVAGYEMAQRQRRSVLHGALYAVIVSATVYTVLDLDNPRVGLIRLDAAEYLLQQLHDSIR